MVKKTGLNRNSAIICYSVINFMVFQINVLPNIKQCFAYHSLRTDTELGSQFCSVSAHKGSISSVQPKSKRDLSQSIDHIWVLV